MSKIEIKIENGFLGLGEEKEVIYEDGKKVGEIRQESTWYGENIKGTYNENGQKISETRKEETIWGEQMDVTRDNNGGIISKKIYAPEGVEIEEYNAQGDLETRTTHERRILDNDLDITRDNEGNVVSITQHKADFFDRPIDVTYDSKGNKISETRAYDLEGNRIKIRHKKNPRKSTYGTSTETEIKSEESKTKDSEWTEYSDLDEEDCIRREPVKKVSDKETAQKIKRINAYVFNWDTPGESIKSIGIESELEIILLFKDSENPLVKTAAINKLETKQENTLRFSSVYDDSQVVRDTARKRLKELGLNIPIKKEFVPDYDLGVTSRFNLRFLEIESRCNKNPDKKRKIKETLDEYFNGPKLPKTPSNNLLLRYRCSRCNHEWVDTDSKETEESDCLFKCSEWETLHLLSKLQRGLDYLINKKELVGKGKLIKSEKMG